MKGEEVSERLAAMLPFYVNGTLDAASRREVDAALEASPRLRALLAQERELAAAVRRDTAGRLEEWEKRRKDD